MAEDMLPLLSVGPFQVTAYSLMLTLAALAGIVCTCLAGKRTGTGEKALPLATLSVIASIVGGHLVWCFTMFPALDVDFGGYSFFLKFYAGGYTLFGAVFAVLLAAFVLSRRWQISCGSLLDTLVPGAAAALCIGRFAEAFNGQGVGQFVEEDGLRFFPFAVCTYMDEEWSEWYVAVFVFEALAALIMLIVALRCLAKKQRDGRTASIFLCLLGASQIFLEQLRADDLIRFGFVRFSQLCSLAVLMVLHGMKLAKVGDTGHRVISSLRLSFAAICIVFIEFAFEKPQFYPYLIAAMIGLALSYTVPAALTFAKKRGNVLQGLIGVLAVGLCAGMIYVLSQGFDNEWDYLFALMALCCAIMACEAWPGKEEKEAKACIM
ncbi:MAG: prolipoprotein diacylglyceryl transferase [Clostridia bacterium]|nr:prolipoprotein diacylglyceryl transferase [Clostridia bacterium]MBR2289011.1 prolipoprotein diacylglyceryl transferase [Clostridia bacterium]